MSAQRYATADDCAVLSAYSSWQWCVSARRVVSAAKLTDSASPFDGFSSLLDPFNTFPQISPVVQLNPLDSVLPRELLMTILNFYRDYVYCIVPFPSWSTLLYDLAGKREERPGQEEWSSMVLAMAAFTAVQVPNQLFPTGKTVVKALIQHCAAAARAYLARPYKQATLNRCFTIFW